MTLLESIEGDIRAGQAQGCKIPAEEFINDMTPYELLYKISDALERAGVRFNDNW